MSSEAYNEIVYKAAEKIIAGGGGTTASPTVVTGDVAADAVDSGAPVKIGGRASSTAPTAVASGDRVNAWMSLNGATVVAGVLVTPADGVANVGSGMKFWGEYSSPGMTMVQPHTFNGTSWDRTRKPNVSKRIASSAASGNPDFLTASAGELTKFWGLNGAAITYVQIYNKASAPTIGTDTPILTYPVAALAPFDVTIPNGGLYFSAGIAYAFTTDAAGTTGAAAAAVTSCNIIGA